MRSETHIDTLRVQAPEEAAQQVQLRLSTTLSGADLPPPGLAPAQVLLVRTLSDPAPGGLDVGTPGPSLDRTWERAARDALTDCLRRAVRPTNGRVPPGAEAVLFDDAAEAWACWTRQRGSADPVPASTWWVQSLERSAEVPSSPRDAMRVADVWRAHPRLVPPIIDSLATWGHVEDVLQQLSTADAKRLLQAVCTAYGVSAPSETRAPEPPSDPEAGERTGEEAPTESTVSDEGPADEPSRTATPDSFEIPPWTTAVERAAGPSLRSSLAQQSRAHRALFGVALALQDDPVVVRSRSFRAAWQAWRTAQEKGEGQREEPPKAPSGHCDQFEADTESEPDAGNDEFSPEKMPGDRGRDATPDDEQERAVQKNETVGEGPYATTDLGGVFYLINILHALDLPAAATTPPIDEYVGAWAVLEGLSRALLGPGPETLRPDDPLWRVLAVLDGRRPEEPAGRALNDAVDRLAAFRLPPTWLEAPHVKAPLRGQWAVRDGRLLVWTSVGAVIDRPAAEDPVAQAEEAWGRYPNTGGLQRADSSEAVPLDPEPDDFAPALARWAARVAPHLRQRLAEALDVDARRPDWTADLFSAEGKLYTTDTHVDLVLPLDAARLDVRAVGLDRNPGWWPAGGRVVRFHFRDTAS